MMSFIMDLENQVWLCSGEPDGPHDVECHFFIDMVPAVTPMKNFDFYFEIEGPIEKGIHAELLAETEEEVAERNKKLNEETKFPFLCNKHFIGNLFAGTDYTINLAFKNRRKYIEDSFSFTTPKPPRPKDNWVWDSEICQWVPPVPPPTPVWDQDSGQWIIP